MLFRFLLNLLLLALAALSMVLAFLGALLSFWASRVMAGAERLRRWWGST